MSAYYCGKATDRNQKGKDGVGGLRSGRQYKTGNINKNYIQMIQVKSELYLVYSR